MSNKPIYSLTPISDHAKELLNAIDNPSQATVINPKASVLLDTYTGNPRFIDRNDKHKIFGTLYGEKHKNNQLYTSNQLKILNERYGAKKVSKDTKYNMITNGHLLVTKENIDQLDADTYISNCSVDFESFEIYEKCAEKGIIFRKCVIYPNGVNTPVRLNECGVCYGEDSI